LFAGRFECKVSDVRIALIGAKAGPAYVNGVLVHEGECSERRFSGERVDFNFPPSGQPVSAFPARFAASIRR